MGSDWKSLSKGIKLSKKVIFWISFVAILGRIEICQANAVEDNFFSASSIEEKRASTSSSIDIHSGFFIFEGRYVPPPYSFQSEHGTVYVNGLRVTQRRPGPFSRRPVNMYRPNRGPMRLGTVRIEQHLREDGLLICTQKGSTVLVPAYQAVSILEILLANESSETKVQKLLQTDTRQISSEQWASLIETFAGTEELSDRIQALKQYQAELSKDDSDFHLHWLMHPMLTFSGFILAVLALGTLISCRPTVLPSSQATVLSEGSCRQVIWLIILIAVLNLYDLACTLSASSMGGLWELNPFASPIIHKSSVVVVFKLGLTVGAVILLLMTRRHRLAQIGSWWIGVLYTVLILRWTTFNTMFM